FLTAKPVLYVANIGEDQIGAETPELKALRDEARTEGAEVIALSARLEAEIRELPDDEAAAFLEDAGLKEAALPTFIHAAYRLLNLVTFLTAGDPGVRAWTVGQGSRAPEAAGVIHSDIERGFIKAEIVAYDDIIAAGSYAAARERGKVRLEGREYVMKDGDVSLFRFNVWRLASAGRCAGQRRMEHGRGRGAPRWCCRRHDAAHNSLLRVDAPLPLTRLFPALRCG